MLRSLKLLLTLSLVLGTAGGITPARADCPPSPEDLQLAGCLVYLTELEGAVASNSVALADAALQIAQGFVDQLSEADSPACTPEVAGKDVLQRTSIVVGEIFGRDQSTGSGFCTKVGGSTYTSRIDVQIQAFNMPEKPNDWTPVCGTVSGYGVPSGQYTQVLPPTTVACEYASGNRFLGKWHRGYVKITTSLGVRIWENVTPNIWFMAP